MKRTLSLSVFLMLAPALLLAQFGSGTPTWGIGRGTYSPDTTKKEKNPTRSLSGTVLSPEEAPVAHAVVYLKNTKTLSVKSYIASDGGAYLFNGLSPNVDYEIYAETPERRSSTKTLSTFDNRSKPTMNLRLTEKKEKPKEDESAKKEEKK